MVVCQAVTVAIQATAMLINCVVTAIARNSTASAVSVRVVVPLVARSTITRTTSGPLRISPDPVATSAPKATQRQASGRSSAARARQRAVGRDMCLILHRRSR